MNQKSLLTPCYMLKVENLRHDACGVRKDLFRKQGYKFLETFSTFFSNFHDPSHTHFLE